MLDPLLILVLIGALGGSIRSILGFFTQSDDGESFNFKKTIASIVRGAVAGLGLSYVTYSIIDTPPTMAMYIGAFILSVGADVLIKETYGTIKELKK